MRFLTCLRAALVALGLAATGAAGAAPPEAALRLLLSDDFDEKAEAIRLLGDAADAQSATLLRELIDGRLHYRKDDKRLVIADKQGSNYRLTDPLTGEDLGEAGRRDARKISLNNQLRGQIRQALSQMNLKHPDPAMRLAAVEEMMGKVEPDVLPVLESMRETETHGGVRDAIDAVVALAALGSGDLETQLAAIETLDGNLNPRVLVELQKITDSDADKRLRDAAADGIKRIQNRLSIFSAVETLFFGLSLGSILALAAIGLAITFGVMGVINMAHGELIMIGAYTAYVVQLLMPDHIGASILVAIPAAFVVSALVGVAIERSVIRFLYGRPLETLLATFGISLILQQAVRSIFSPLNRPVATPDWMSGSLEINSVLSLTYNRIYILLFCILVFALLYLVMTRTSLGLQVRAISQNRPMARAMGIRSQWVDAMTFALGSGIAGIAGVALSQITNVGPNLGQSYIVDSFMVVVFGGVGNLWGTLLSGMTLGIVGKFLEPATGAVLAKILVLIFIILYIQKRPRGMFPQKGRAAEQ